MYSGRMSDNLSIEYARELDARDPLARFRGEFIITDPGLIYLDGNSLGRLPQRSAALLEDAVRRQWGEELIRSWNAGWLEAPARIGDKIGRLVGAGPGQVIVSDSTSINLYKLASAGLALRPGRGKIVSDAFNFPSDLYVLQGLADERGRRLERVASRDGIHIETEDILRAVDADAALVCLSLAAFKSGFLYDGAEITRRAQAAGALVLWDLSHAAGAVPVDLDGWQADFAVGCTYKYLNGGPGAPAFLYVRRDLQELCRSPIQGWFGQRDAFQFGLDYAPAQGIQRFACGTPPVLSLLAVEAGVDLLLEAGMAALRAKSSGLSEYLIELADARLARLGFSLGSPRSPDRRGGHVSLRHPEGYRVNRALIEELDVIPDFREPDNLRLGPAPLYTSYAEVWEAVERIRLAVAEGLYQKYPSARLAVT
jgi:kynureninase